MAILTLVIIHIEFGESVNMRFNHNCILALIIAALFSFAPAAAQSVGMETVELADAGGGVFQLDASNDEWRRVFETGAAGEAFLALEIHSPDTSWRSKTDKGVVLKTYLDGENYADIVVFGGKEKLEYTAYAGELTAGEHTVTITFDEENSPAPGGTAIVSSAQLRVVPEEHPDHIVCHNSPILHLLDGRADNDVPLLVFYDRNDKPDSTYISYETVFSNEDGGTGYQPAILMAQWGRTTDIEQIYWAVIDRKSGEISRQQYQGSGHNYRDFDGHRIGGHPVLRVSTDNGMFDDEGETAVKLSPMPVRFDRRGRPRDAIMDDHPWTFRIMNEEMFAEEKATMKKGPAAKALLGDTRTYIFIDFTAANNNGKRTLEFLAGLKGTKNLYSSDPKPMFSNDMHAGRLAKNGTYRTNIKIPHGARPADVEKIIVRGGGDVDYNIKRIDAFMLGRDYVPEPYFFSFEGDVHLTPDSSEAVFSVGQD